MVSDRHILFLVAAWARTRRDLSVTVLSEDMARVATMLKRANHRSVMFRYPNEEPMPDEFLTFLPAQMPPVPGSFDPVAVIKAAQCLDYQSCEPDDWDQTDAARLLQGLINDAIARLPGWRDAAWCIPDGAPAPTKSVRHDLGRGRALHLCPAHDAEYTVAAASSAVGRDLDTRAGLAASSASDHACEVCALPSSDDTLNH